MRWLVVLLALLSACGGGGGGGERAGLSDLTSVDELRVRFNEDRGEPRLILVLSPT